MNLESVRELLESVRSGRLSADDAVATLRALPFTASTDALVDHHRHLRTGMPEAVYGPGKSPEQVALIVGELLANGDGAVVLTRATTDQSKAALSVDASAEQCGSTLVWRAWKVRWQVLSVG